MRDLLKAARNITCFKSNNPGRKKGCFIPDVYQAGSRLLELKTSFGAVKKAQFKEFIKLSLSNQGTRFSMIFYKQPSVAEMQTLQKWAVEAAKDIGRESDDMLFNILYKVAH